MHFGVHLFPTESSIQPAALARAVEDRRLESVWFSEHTHIPVAYLHKADQAGHPLPDYYWQTYDPFVALSQAAAATEKIKIATGVALIIERDPIILANEVATLDRLSGGRFIFGVGAGWNKGEMANHGVVYRTRYRLFREQIRAMKAIWTTGVSEFHGDFVDFDAIRSFPKPQQQPHPPLIMGGAGEKSLECALDVCDGWAPWLMAWPRAKAIIADLRVRAPQAGRDPASLAMSVFVDAIPGPETLAEMEEVGLQQVILTLFAGSREEALPLLDDLAALDR